MENAIYATLTRQAGLMREMHVVANNIANISTTTLHDTEVFGVAVIGESESSDGLDLAKGTVH